MRARAQALSAADVATFQANLQSLMNWLSQAAASDPIQQAQISDLQTRINSLTSDQMTTLANTFDNGAFNAAVNLLTTTVPAPPVIPPTDPPANLSPPSYGICVPTTGPPQIPSDPGTEKNLLIGVEVAQAADIIAADACNSYLEILGVGTNAPGCIIKLVTDFILYGLQTTKARNEFCDSNVLDDQINSFWLNTIVIDTDIANLAGNHSNSFTQITNQLTTFDTNVDNQISSISGNTTTQFTQVNNQLAAMNTSLGNQDTAIDLDVDNHIAAVGVDLTKPFDKRGL
jgi:hypothetical protein